ncbi:MAG: HAD family hydrolase [Intestinimonas sp.]
MARPMQAAGTPLCEGAEALLHALRAAGVATAVVSTKHTETLESIFAQHGLLDVFSFVIGGDKVRRPKPDPEGLNTAVERLGLVPEQVLYCGDTVIDAGTADNAGTDFCAVLNGTTPAAAFAAFPHVHIAPDLPDLRRFLGL